MIKLIPLQENLIKNIADILLKTGSYDLSDYKIIFPTKRGGVFLRDYLSLKIGKPYLPPEVWTMESFISTLFDKFFHGYERADKIKAASLIYKAFNEIDDKGYISGEKNNDFLSFFPWALKLLTVVEEILIESGLGIEKINPSEYRFFIEYGEYHKGYKSFLEKLPALTIKFVNLLEEEGKATRGYIYYKTADMMENSDDKSIFSGKHIFAGFNALNRAELTIIKKFLREGEENEIIFRTDIKALENKNSPFRLQKEAMDNLEIEKTIIPVKDSIGWNDFGDKIEFYPVKNIETEMFEISRILKRIIENEKEIDLKDIGIVLSDPSNLIPFVHGVVSRLNGGGEKIPFNITIGYPFNRTPMFQLIDYILETGLTKGDRGIISENYLNLLRHPYVKLSREDKKNAEPLKTAIHFIENMISKENLIYVNKDLMEESLEKEDKYFGDKEKKGDAIKEIKRVHKTFIIDEFTGLTDLCLFLKNSMKSISVFEGKTNLFLNEYKAVAVNTIDEMLEFIKENSEDFKNSDFKNSVDFIKYYFSQKNINFLGSPLKGIQVMGLMEFSGLKFKHLIIADNIEGILPRNFKYDPLLPYDIRKLFGLRTYKDYEALFGYNYFSIIAAAEKVGLLWSSKQTGGEFAEKSRFIERIVYELEKSEKQIKTIKKVSEFIPHNRTLKIVKKDEKIKEIMRNMELSPSSVRLYMDCPLKFYFQKIMNLEEKRELEKEPDAGIFGTIVHETLRELYQPFIGKELSPDGINSIKNNLEKTLEKNFQSSGFSLESGIIRLRFWAVLEKLNEFLKYEEERISENTVKIRYLEKYLTKEMEFSGINLKLKGFVDRIDEEGGVVKILDYKTGKPESVYLKTENIEYRSEDFLKYDGDDYLELLDRFSKIYKSIQIILYIKLYDKYFNNDKKDIRGAYIFLRGERVELTEIFKKNKNGYLSDDEINLFLENFDYNFYLLLKDMYQRDSFIPNPSDNRCSYCPFRTVCGTV